MSTSNSSLNSSGSRRKMSKKNSLFSIASNNSFAQLIRSSSSSPSLMNEMVKRKKSLRSKSSRSTLADMHEITARKMGYVMPGDDDDDDLEFSAQKPKHSETPSGIHFALRKNHSRTRSSVSRSTLDEEMESTLTNILLLSNRDAIQAKWQMCQCCCLSPATWKRNKRRRSSMMRQEEEGSQVRTKKIALKSFESSSSSSPSHVGSWRRKNTSSIPKSLNLPETPMWIPKESFGAMFNFQCNFVPAQISLNGDDRMMKIKFTVHRERQEIFVPLTEIMCIFTPFRTSLEMKEMWEVRILMSRDYFERKGKQRKPERAVMRFRFVKSDDARKWSDSIRERRREVLDIHTYLSPKWKDHRTKSRTESIFGHESSSPVFTPPSQQSLFTMTPIPMTPGFRHSPSKLSGNSTLNIVFVGIFLSGGSRRTHWSEKTKSQQQILKCPHHCIQIQGETETMRRRATMERTNLMRTSVPSAGISWTKTFVRSGIDVNSQMHSPHREVLIFSWWHEKMNSRNICSP